MRLVRRPLAICLLACLSVGAVPAATLASPARSTVIVRANAGSGQRAAAAIRSLGGTVTYRLHSLHGFVALLQPAEIARLAAADGVASVTPDRHVTLTSLGPDGSDASALGSLSSVASSIGATDYWRAGYLGRGVDVAVVDSGVSPVQGLDQAGKLVQGPDLSFESQAPNLAHLDTFGHGTNMAGIIAGNDTGAGMHLLPLFNPSDTKHFMGIAPAARIVSLKVADAFGNTDVSQVIMAIDWVITHQNDHELNLHIGVLNLSFGTDGTQAYTLDPLAYVVEQAWKNGIFVVVSAGNAGYGTPKLNDPAYDPFVMAVGAADPEGTPALGDDTVADFSSGGNESRRPDVVAPGKGIVSLRDPNSLLDQVNPGARIGDTPRLFRGSGTSQAAAVVSGAAALIISQRPGIKPDRLKQLLKSTAVNLGGERPTADGKGEINLHAAFNAPTPGGGDSNQNFPPSTGNGSLDGSRGSFVLQSGGDQLTGDRDIFGTAIDLDDWAHKSKGGDAWDDNGRWMGDAFTGNEFDGTVWEGRSWTATDWSGRSWTSDAWTGRSWTGSGWDGRSWTGSGWDGRSWTGRSWTSGSWASNVWSSSDWN